MFCKHNWKLIQEVITKAPFEVAVDTLKNSVVGGTSIPHQMCDTSRKHITTFTCDKCGKIKRYVVRLD